MSETVTTESIREKFREYFMKKGKRATPPDDTELDELLGVVCDRVRYLTFVTHAGKYLHPQSSCVGLLRNALPEISGYVCTSGNVQPDVVGCATGMAAGDFLKVACDGLVPVLAEKNPDVLKAALGGDDLTREARLSAILTLLQRSREFRPCLQNAKQVYFPVEDGYHLIVPLFPASLAAEYHAIIRDDVYAEETKAARAARRAGESFDGSFRDHQNLLRQTFGGTKPQNISRGNMLRGGQLLLLSSLPPTTRALPRLPLQVACVTDIIARFPGARHLRQRLAATDGSPEEIEVARKKTAEDIAEIFFQWGSGVREAGEPGWSSSSECLLCEKEKRWLDPGADVTVEDWKERLAEKYARWTSSWLGFKTDKDIFRNIFRCFD